MNIKALPIHKEGEERIIKRKIKANHSQTSHGNADHSPGLHFVDNPFL